MFNLQKYYCSLEYRSINFTSGTSSIWQSCGEDSDNLPTLLSTDNQSSSRLLELTLCVSLSPNNKNNLAKQESANGRGDPGKMEGPKRDKAGSKLSVERVYQKKTQLEHILLRPDTYIGSVEPITQVSYDL